MKSEYLDQVLATVTSSHNRITLASHEDCYQSCIEIGLIQKDASTHDSFTIDLSLVQRDEVVHNISVDDYLIRFTIGSKILKKCINESPHIKMMTIEKQDGGYLRFKTNYNHKVCFTKSFRDDCSIKLDSKLTNRDYFNIDLDLESIQPFTFIKCDVANVFMDSKHVTFEKVFGDHVITARIQTKVKKYVT